MDLQVHNNHIFTNMASNHKSPSPLLDIDLNVEFTNPEIDDENSQQQNANEIYPHLPDLNIIAGENVDIDLNQLPNSPPFEPYEEIHVENSANEDMESEFGITSTISFNFLFQFFTIFTERISYQQTIWI